MESVNANSASPIARLIPVLIFAAALIGIYYLYQYLYGVSTGNSYTLITGNQLANPAVSPTPITSDKLPGLYEGGEFTFSTWIYINDWSYNKGYNKHIVSIGGTSFDTIWIYLGAWRPKLYVRLHTAEGTTAPVPTRESLDPSSKSAKFASSVPDGSLREEENALCDLPSIEMQRWVNISVAVNGKTVDVYMDGKLARSCVLPASFKVATAYSAKLLETGDGKPAQTNAGGLGAQPGFGGHIATTIMYDAALNPEQVYKNYVAGPEPITSFGAWFMSFFSPTVNNSATTNGPTAAKSGQ
jgi:hypothetical protein